MAIRIRKLIVVSVITAVSLVANVWVIAGWLDDAGLVAWARSLCSEYFTGTALVVIAVLLVLLGPSTRHAVTWIRRCPVCDHTLARQGRYCAECGSRV